MALVDLSAYLDDDALEIPGVKSTRYPRGHNYVIPGPDAATGLWMQSLAGIGMKAATGAEITEADGAEINATLDDGDERNLYERVLGVAHDEMVADGVSWPALSAIGKYAFLYYTMGREGADAAMAAELDGPPNRAARRGKATSSPYRASAVTARKTQPRASTAGTTSARNARPKKTAQR